MEREILKGGALFAKEMKYDCIKSHQIIYPVQSLCKVM